jgi:hypothetical protein
MSFKSKGDVSVSLKSQFNAVDASVSMGSLKNPLIKGIEEISRKNNMRSEIDATQKKKIFKSYRYMTGADTSRISV